jgi:sporulation protein YlmC with PRC-barrel domain
MLGLENIVGKEIITADAIILGTVEGIALDTDLWKVPAIRVSVKKGNEAALNLKKKTLGVQRVHVVTPQVSSVSDTVTLAIKMDNIKEVLMDDQKVPMAAGELLNKKVVAHDGKQLGYLDNVYFEPSQGWDVTKVSIKLDKTAKQALDLKKGVAPSSQIVVLTKDIKTVGDMVMLRLDLEGLKDYLQKKPVSKK